MTIKEIAETIIRMTGSTSRIVYRPLPTDDPKVRKPDITRARTLLGWEPKVDARRGPDVDDRLLPPEAGRDRRIGTGRAGASPTGSRQPTAGAQRPAGPRSVLRRRRGADRAEARVAM